MVELRAYFCQTYYKHEYYVNMFQDLLTWRGSGDEFWIYDEQDAIDKFKELIQPYNPNNPIVDTVNDNNFIYLCNYLNDIGYYIEEFPNFLERPTERWNLSDDIVKGYRNKLECFRHSTKEDIDKRANYTDSQKDFFINYGLVIIDYINKKIND